LDLPHYLRLAWRLMKDSRVPWRLKLFVVFAVLYGISPLDLLPEAINPLVGFGEDFLILLISLWSLIRNSPPEVVKQHAREITRDLTREDESDDGDVREGQE
jgi:uncharacterized membrane protein YkvA (DUF1232 family)